MKKWIVLGLCLGLSGCASNLCDKPWSDSTCEEQRLLFENDLLQAKILIVSGDLDSLELADALLKRAAALDDTGETDFYQAVRLIRLGPQPEEVIRLLEHAAKRNHPHAIALLYKIYAEPYLIQQAQPEKAEQYREAYSRLDVAKSGYPSFEKALSIVNALVNPPPEVVGNSPVPTP
jgi:hypothetical protein